MIEIAFRNTALSAAARFGLCGAPVLLAGGDRFA